MNMGKSLSEDLYLSYSRSLTPSSRTGLDSGMEDCPNFSLLGDYSAAEGLRGNFSIIYVFNVHFVVFTKFTGKHYLKQEGKEVSNHEFLLMPEFLDCFPSRAFCVVYCGGHR